MNLIHLVGAISILATAVYVWMARITLSREPSQAGQLARELSLLMGLSIAAGVLACSASLLCLISSAVPGALAVLAGADLTAYLLLRWCRERIQRA